MHKSQKNASPEELFYKKHKKEIFRQTDDDTRWKPESTQSNEEHHDSQSLCE